MLEKFKNLSRRQITFIVGTLLLMNVLSFIIPDSYKLDYAWLSILLTLLQNIGFIARGDTMSYVNISFVGILFLGYVLYILTRGHEMRLLRLALSLMILTNALCILNLLSSFGVFNTILAGQTFIYWFSNLLFVVRIAFYLFLVGCLLVSLKKKRKLDTFSENDPDNHNAIGIGDHVYVAASKWLRFANFLLDTIFSLIPVFFIVYCIEMLFQYRIADVSEVFVPLVLGSRFLYYCFFEFFLGTTPAKYLTETRVVPLYDVETIADGKDKPRLMTVLIRTLSRFFPFEPIFFLCGKPLHDTWSDTEVIREERTGVKGRTYLYAFVIMFILVGVGIYGILEYKEGVRRELYKMNTHNNKMALIKRISLLEKGDYIELKDEESYRNYVYVVLDVKEDSLVCCQLALSKGHITEIDDSFQNLGGLDTDIFDDGAVNISREELFNSVNVEEYSNDIVMLGEDMKPFMLEDVYIRREARVDKNVSSSSVRTPYGEENSSYNFYFQNKGWPIHVLATSVVEGELDLEVDGRGTVVSISGYGNSKKNKTIKVAIVARNYRGEFEKYIFDYEGSGVDDVRELKKLE